MGRRPPAAGGRETWNPRGPCLLGQPLSEAHFICSVTSRHEGALFSAELCRWLQLLLRSPVVTQICHRADAAPGGWSAGSLLPPPWDAPSRPSDPRARCAPRGQSCSRLAGGLPCAPWALVCPCEERGPVGISS